VNGVSSWIRRRMNGRNGEKRRIGEEGRIGEGLMSRVE